MSSSERGERADSKTVRIPLSLAERVETWAKAPGVSVSAACSILLDRALEGRPLDGGGYLPPQLTPNFAQALQVGLGEAPWALVVEGGDRGPTIHDPYGQYGGFQRMFHREMRRLYVCVVEAIDPFFLYVRDVVPSTPGGVALTKTGPGLSIPRMGVKMAIPLTLGEVWTQLHQTFTVAELRTLGTSLAQWMPVEEMIKRDQADFAVVSPWTSRSPTGELLISIYPPSFAPDFSDLDPIDPTAGLPQLRHERHASSYQVLGVDIYASRTTKAHLAVGVDGVSRRDPDALYLSSGPVANILVQPPSGDQYYVFNQAGLALPLARQPLLYYPLSLSLQGWLPPDATADNTYFRAVFYIRQVEPPQEKEGGWTCFGGDVEMLQLNVGRLADPQSTEEKETALPVPAR